MNHSTGTTNKAQARVVAIKETGCAYCGLLFTPQKISERHKGLYCIVPVARGGRSENWNLQLTCPRCNLNKSARDPIEFMQSRGMLL